MTDMAMYRVVNKLTNKSIFVGDIEDCNACIDDQVFGGKEDAQNLIAVYHECYAFPNDCVEQKPHNHCCCCGDVCPVDEFDCNECDAEYEREHFGRLLF